MMGAVLLPASQRSTAAPARGATLPYVELEAEDAATNGTIIGPDRVYTHLPSEASGRKAVQLAGKGQYVEFTLPQKANSIVVRYSIPDSQDGKGLTAPIGLYVDGVHKQDLSFTSKYSWFYGSYPFNNSPWDTNPHHFYDETRALLDEMPAGAKVRMQIDAADAAPFYVIDFADFEEVAPALAQPADAISLTTFGGADPSGAKDATDALEKTIAEARSTGKVAWIPSGTFTITRHVTVDKVTLRGAGPWYSILQGAGVGIFGNAAPSPSDKVTLADFAIFGEVAERKDNEPANGIGGAFSNSIIQNIWIEHTKVGIWLDGPFTNLTITHCIIRNQTADGINFHRGVTHSTVQQTMIRNTGDDGLAMWSETDANQDNVFAFNTVSLPIMANAIAIYGGSDNTISDNVLTDTVSQGGGIHVANRFKAVPVGGTTTITRNTLIRAGSYDAGFKYGIGAVWFYALDTAMSGNIVVSDVNILDSSYAAIQFTGSNITNVSVDQARITGAGTFAVQLQAHGSATFNNVAATKLGAAGIYNCGGKTFTLNQGTGNSGWTDKPYCGPWPMPKYSN